MLVEKMKDEDIELQNGEGATAICLAVASTVQMVDILLKMNKGLLKIRKKGDLQFLCAVLSGDKHVVEHIYSKTDLVDHKWNYADKKCILDSCLAFGLLACAGALKPHERNMIQELAGEIVQMSRQKFAYNVAKKCLTSILLARRVLLKSPTNWLKLKNCVHQEISIYCTVAYIE